MKLAKFVLLAGFVVIVLGFSALPIMPRSISLGRDLGIVGVILIVYGLITIRQGRKTYAKEYGEKSNPILESYETSMK